MRRGLCDWWLEGVAPKYARDAGVVFVLLCFGLVRALGRGTRRRALKIELGAALHRTSLSQRVVFLLHQLTEACQHHRIATTLQQDSCVIPTLILTLASLLKTFGTYETCIASPRQSLCLRCYLYGKVGSRREGFLQSSHVVRYGVSK